MAKNDLFRVETYSRNLSAHRQSGMRVGRSLRGKEISRIKQMSIHVISKMNGVINLVTSESYTLILLKLSQKEYFCKHSSFLLYYCYYLERRNAAMLHNLSGLSSPSTGMKHVPLQGDPNHWTAR